jgi:predicted transcriptional regulator YdeE
MENDQIEIVTLEEKHFIGVPVTTAFQRVDTESMREAYQRFLTRKSEIQGTLNQDEYVCPHFANDILFTYIYCMEVTGTEDVPQGMVGFSIPSQRYVKVRSKDKDPYALVKSFLREESLENNRQSLALEVFKFGEDQHFHNADIYVPIY